jgi:transglutaminase-like putative cysteine protease
MGTVCVGALAVLKYERVLRAMRRMGVRYEFSVEEIAWIVNAALARVPGAKCLARALVAESILRASGHAARICIGVSMEGSFGAHAWVEIGGRAVVGGAADREYERLIPVRSSAL